MSLLNYTTSVAAAKSLAEIQAALAKFGAEQVAVDYAAGQPVGLSFSLRFRGQSLAYRLPCKTDAVLNLLRRDSRVPKAKRTLEHARRVAWRNLKDWVRAQLALLETEQVQATEVFLPYMLVGEGQTCFEQFADRSQRQLTAGDDTRQLSTP